MDTDFIPPQDSGLPGTMVTTPLKSPPPQDYAKKLVSRWHGGLFYLVRTSSLFALPSHLPSSLLLSSLLFLFPPFSFLYFSLILLFPSFIPLFSIPHLLLHPFPSLPLIIFSPTGRGPSQEIWVSPPPNWDLLPLYEHTFQQEDSLLPPESHSTQLSPATRKKEAPISLNVSVLIGKLRQMKVDG